jgi:TonB-dependent receptor
VKTSPFKRQVGTLTAVAGAVLVLSAQVQAQTQTVTVTGIRSAIESAISLKKNSDNIVEAISAEDIGKLPDSSVAESISRLPGVASQRNKSSGRAQSISVRGMSPDFNGGLLNGREVASSGDSRGVDFDLYPAELLNSVLVYKTPHAGLMGQGLSSTIDLRTIRPLDIDSVLRSVAKTHRVLIVEEQKPFASVGSQLAYMIQREAFDELDGPIHRLATVDAPAIYSPPVEVEQLPNPRRVLQAALATLA